MSLFDLLSIAGGVALILFGVRFLRKGLDRLFGQRLGAVMNRTAGGHVRAFLTGIGAAVVAPSSTTISVLAVNTAQSRLLPASAMFALMLGANIGLTITVVLISLRVEQYAPIMVLVGVVLFQFTQPQLWRGIGQAILALAFIFLGVGTIKATAGNFELAGDLMDLIAIAERHPILLAVIAAFMATAMQSSTATIALVLSLGAAGTVGLSTAVAAVVGANIGIVITTLMVGWRQLESRRLAMANFLAKGTTAVIVLATLPWVVELLERLPGQFEQYVAYAHSGYNLLLAALFLPLVGPVSRAMTRLAPDPPVQPGGETFGPLYINQGEVDSMALGLGQSMREIMRAAEIVRNMLQDIWRGLLTNDADLARRAAERDDQVDLLDHHIKRFLVRLSGLEGNSREAAEQMLQLRYLNELETIGDIIDKNLAELVFKKVRLNVSFSQEGLKDLNDFYEKVRENMTIAEAALTTRDRSLAQKLLRHKERLDQEDRLLRDRHFDRLKAGTPESYESSSIHLDVLTHLRRINSCVTHVAYGILQSSQEDTRA